MAELGGSTCEAAERSVVARVPPLLTDLYQFTMTYGYWRAGRHREHSAFELFFRENPFGGSFSLFAGLDDCLLFLRNFRFTEQGGRGFGWRYARMLFTRRKKNVPENRGARGSRDIRRFPLGLRNSSARVRVTAALRNADSELPRGPSALTELWRTISFPFVLLSTVTTVRKRAKVRDPDQKCC